MKKLLSTSIFLLLGLLVFSQQQNNLSKHVYFFGPVIDSINCKIVAECDCCSDDILFLNDTEFVSISYCVPNITIQKGAYFVSSNKVILKYSGRLVSKVLDEALANSKGKEKYTFKTEKIKPYKTILTSFYCKKTLFYKTNETDISYGTMSKNDTVDKHIKELKSEGLWGKLFK